MGLKDQRFSILICADNNADTNTVYITEEFLVAQENNINAGSKVIIEELNSYLWTTQRLTGIYTSFRINPFSIGT